MIQVVREFKPSAVFMGRLAKGADIINSLEAFCLERHITAAWVNVIGAVDKATISYYDQREHKYFHRPLYGEYEIVSCSGNISLKEGKPFAHLHIVLSDTDYATCGGHLWPGTVGVFAAEFVMHVLEGASGELKRCPDVETGLALW
jgi:predicted DNA-binding protein with PD1-like motif